jgi:hypothetical protein
MNLLVHLFLLNGIFCAASEANIFGIGVYTDTPGSPPLSSQLGLASDLVGQGGWVVLYLCAWKHSNGSCVNRSTTHDPLSNEMLNLAYAKGLNVVARVGNPYYVREHSDEGSNYTSYKELAQAYSSLVDSFPLPPAKNQKLYVQVGNEFNACNEWKCDGSAASSMSTQEMAKEVGGFYRDVLEALVPIREKHSGQLMLGHGAIASWTTSPCECGTGRPLGKGQLGLNFLKMMVGFYPKLYTGVDFLSSHSYPFSQTPYGSPKAMRGLAYYRNESRVVGRPKIPVHVTETGWRRYHITFTEQAEWMVKSFQNIWLPDQQLLSVCPFLLAGTFWDAGPAPTGAVPHSSHGGWTWVNSSTLGPFPVFESVKKLREGNLLVAS